MKDELYDYFLTILKKKFPRRAELTRALMELLAIEKEAVYRRLRKEVAFTFNEVAMIANAWGISLDTVTRVAPTRNLPFHLQLTNYLNPPPDDIQVLRRFTELLRLVSGDPRAEIMEATNWLPLPLYHAYDHLGRFAAFKWMYQCGDAVQAPTFGEITLPGEVRRLLDEQHLLLKKIPRTFYVLDHMAFAYLINDIRYFSSIYLITPGEVERLREEILQLLDQLEMLTTTGIFPETGDRVYIYISPVNFDVNYCCIEGNSAKVSMTRAFIMNTMVSLDEYAFKKWKNCILAMKRSSTLISESGEKHRIEFFEKQRALVGGLTS
ncbi:MAG: hypothetical protein LBK12_02890 [Odoribacteraceae bacterium]|jgi:hypothetical protein|nr:hypothetical protein [Odoribacteraceae bacterium]